MLFGKTVPLSSRLIALAFTSMARLVLAGTVVFAISLPTANERHTPKFTLEQITRVRTLGDVALSPDGTRAACALGGYYFEFAVIPRFGDDNNIRVITLATGESRRVTDGIAPKTNPVFSPSGRRLAYESEGDVWFVDLETGASRRVTTHPGADREPTWSPDEQRLAFVSDRGGRVDLWAVSVEGERHGLWQLTREAGSESDPRWSPDGATLLFTVRAGADRYAQAIFAMPAAGGQVRRLTPDDEFEYAVPRWSPDSRSLAFTSDRNGWVRVWTMRPDGSERREFDTGPHDAAAAYWNVAPIWSPNADRLLVSVNRDGRYVLAMLGIADGGVEFVGDRAGSSHAVGFSAGGGVVYVHEARAAPPDLFTQSADRRVRQLTYSSHIAFQPEHFPHAKRVRFPSLDGLEVAGFVLTPSTVAAGERLPALIALHPNAYGQFTDHWAPFFDFVAQSGYVVMLFDQRGSAGYGRAFRLAQNGAWGTKTVDDVRAAAAFLKTQPGVDGNRVGVMGLSFGGYLTLLALTQSPEVFAAGIDLMGPTDRRRPFSTPSRAVQIGATEEQDPELYRRISPIAGVSALKAPLLIIHSDGDRNVAPEHSYRLVDELLRHGKSHEVKFYPGEAHGLADPAHQLDSFQRILAFFDRHLAR
jgi:dipeptidyl aminopeptidase/acylaminoacyl peptidase